MKLGNDTAIVTGGASGIGKAIAEAFAKEGASVVVADLRPEKAKAVVDGIEKDGGKAIAVGGDVSLADDVSRIMETTLAAFGEVTVMVNNAGIILQANVVDTTEEQWDKILTNNLKSCFLCSREAARQMIKQGKGGRIINISSIHATLSEPSAGAYTAAKGGMEAFSRTMASEVARHKIRVNCIEPGATYTELTLPMYTEAVKKALFQRVPMQEIAQPEWIASGAVFLACEDSRYMTGQTLVLDGGYIMDGSLPGAEYWEG